ncbi:MAG: hypothetical protein KKD44_27805 [Proteobacteria bacterium]|nr:hypothetical protein [Pseudomonadota bacterium]
MKSAKDRMWAEIEEAGLHGPWSWSDMLDLASRIVAYGILRLPNKNHEEVVDGILAHIRKSALFMVDGER